MKINFKPCLLALAALLAPPLVATAQIIATPQGGILDANMDSLHPPLLAANSTPAPVVPEVEAPPAPAPLPEGFTEDPAPAPQPPPNQEEEALSAQAAAASTPTGNIVVNLINKLVEKGILAKEDAEMMVTQAQAEAETQKAQQESDMFAIAQIAATQTMSEIAVAPPLSPLEASKREMSTSVTYIPAPVRAQLTEDIRRELAGTIGGETKPPPGLPTILGMLRPQGELRFRYEADLYPDDNDATGAFPNFNAINTGNPFDVTGLDFAPQWNTDQNRNRYRLLARFGFGIDLGQNFTAGLRLATGDNNSPTSANQSVGLANQGQGGQFSKYAVWLDRAWLRYDLGGGPNNIGATAWLGRFDNPFFSTDLIFDNDLGFDGLALRLSYNYEDAVLPYFTAGAFPVFNTELNFSSNAPQKYPSSDKYLLAIQGGTQINLTRHWTTEMAAAYYYFYNIEGQLSAPFFAYTQNDQGDTDNTRPSFAQKGNTYFPLRQIIPGPYNDFGAINQWQYFGLATPFQNLALTGKLTYDGFEPVTVSLIGEFVQNLAFDTEAIDAIAVNNRGAVISDDPDIDTSATGPFEGSGTAWLVDLEVGHAELDKLGAWQLAFGYRWIGSDAVVDGFNDSDFGLGGTNMKGFTVAARMALTPHVYMGLRWFGSESIAGPQFDMNIFQFDVGAKF